MIWILITCLLFSACSPKEKKPHSSAIESVTWSDRGSAEEIKKIIEGFEIQTLFDFSTRDINEFQQLGLPLKLYIGATTEGALLEKLRAAYGSQLQTFLDHDIAADPLPQVDLLLLWDRLNTLPPSEIRSALLLIKKSGARFLLIAQDSSCTKNHKSKHGELQPINWQLEPYAFPKPLIEITKPNQRSLALWPCDELP
jgi:hypothetical protein